MNQRLIMVVSGLFLLTFLLWQRSLYTHYSYTRSELEKEKVILSKQVKTLQMEIHQLATPATLYSYWMENEEDLEFIEVVSHKEAEPEDNSEKASESKPKSKSHMASFKGRSF